MNPPARRARRIWLAGALVLILCLGGLFLFLPRLVETVLIASLEQAGFPEPGLRVTDIGWRQATLTDLRLGIDSEVKVDELVVTYSPADLLRRQVDRIGLRGFRLTVRLDGEGPPFGSLGAPLTALGNGTPGGTDTTIPDIALEEGRVMVATRLGPIVVPLEGTAVAGTDGVTEGRFVIPPGAVGLPEVTARQLSGTMQFALTSGRLSRLAVQLDLADLAVSTAAVEAVTLAVDLLGDSGTAHLTIAEGGDALDLRAEATVADIYGTPELTGKAEATVTAASLFWQLIGMPPPIEGSASLTGNASGRLSRMEERFSFVGDSAINVAADDAALEAQAQGQIVLRQDGIVDSFAVEDGDMTLRNLPLGGSPLDATMTNAAFAGTPDAFTGTAQIALASPELEMPTVHATEIVFAADTSFAFTEGRFTLQPRGDAQLMAQRLVVPGILAATAPLHLPLHATEAPALTLDFTAAAGPHLDHDLKVGPARLAARLQPNTADPLPIDVTLRTLSATGSWSLTAGYRGSASVGGGELLLQEQQIAATGVEAELVIGGPDSSGEAHLRIAEITHHADPPLFAPAPMRADAALSGDHLAFTIRASAAGERAVLTVRGQHDLRSGAGAAEIGLPPVAFAPDVLEPEDLAPVLKGRIEQTTGTVALAGTLSWNPDGTASDLQMLLRDLSFITSRAEVILLNSVIRFDSILPLSTPPNQWLAVGLVDSVIPLTDGVATFQLRRNGELVVDEGRFRLAGGEISVDPVVIDLNAPENRMNLAVTDAALSELLALADIDGLSATGRLDGRIPVRLAEDVIIQGGVLRADAPGRLSYDPVSPPAALQAPGETISLLLSALTNFEYHALRLTVDREAGGEMLVSVHIAGKNPAFYDGYPVELNFNISGKLDQALQQSLIGYRIPDAIRERLSAFPE